MRRAALFARDRTATVLIEGETGTGKTRLAHAIHEISPHGRAPYTECDLSTLDDGFASDALFGHVPGAFTGASKARDGYFVSATGGTLFLDEVGKASLHFQQRLLRAIEYHFITPVGSERTICVDVRVIVASNVPLEQLVDEGRFLPDLYQRLKSFRIALPPLRERVGDIPSLARKCLAEHAANLQYQSLPSFDADLARALNHAKWPGNLRELDGTIHRLVLEAQGAAVLTTNLCTGDLAWLVAPSREKKRARIEDVRNALLKTEGDKTAAGRMLGVSRWTIDRRLEAAGSARATGLPEKV